MSHYLKRINQNMLTKYSVREFAFWREEQDLPKILDFKLL